MLIDIMQKNYSKVNYVWETLDKTKLGESLTVGLLRACDKLVYIVNFQKEDLVHKHYPNILNLRGPNPPFLRIFGEKRLVFYGTHFGNAALWILSINISY